MTSYIRENPFIRKINFEPLAKQNTSRISNNISRYNNDNKMGIYQTRIAPFQKQEHNQIFERKNYQSESKMNEQNYRYFGTYFPLSRYQNRKRLRELDTENWKKQIQEEERYKLNHYGSQALRYSSYSTEHNSFASNHLHKNKNYSKPVQKQIKKQQFYESNRSRNQYMLYPKNNFQVTDRYQQPNRNFALNKRITQKSNQKQQITYIEDRERFKANKDNDKYEKNIGIQRKQTAYFNDHQENIKQDNHKNQHFFQKQTSFGQYGSGDQDNFIKPFGRHEKNDSRNFNSYNSNIDNQRFYDSDYINQQDESETKGPLHAMKFSSSSNDSEVQQGIGTKFNAFRKVVKNPDCIIYDGREFYKIDVVL